MAFDFPSSPTVGQQFTPVAGTTYTWNGYAWVTPAGGGSLSVSVQRFTASGTYTPAVGMQFCIIECVGGGAGGGGTTGTSAQYFAAGGGGSGGYSRHRATAAEIGASQAVTIGTAGNGGAVGANNGADAGDTSVGTLCVGKGGGGGRNSNNTGTPNGGGGLGGIAGTGNILTAAGSPGGNGFLSTVGASTTSGHGGSSSFGGGASGVYTSGTATTGLNAGNYGAGGSGGMSSNTASSAAGGAGSAGIVIITEYVPTGAASAGGTSTTISDTPPASPANGSLWWESDTGTLWISYNDGTSTQWVTAGGGTSTVAVAGPPQGRLTLQTATPVMTTTQAAKTTIFYTPYIGNLVPIYNGTNFSMSTFAELSVLTTDTTKSPAAIGASKVNDWFVWNDAGTLRIGHGPDWTSDTVRSAGTALVMVNGIWLNNAAITNGPAAQRGTYVGTTRSNASSQLDWIFGGLATNGTAGFFGLWNAYNRRRVRTAVEDLTTSWTLAAPNTRQANNSSTMRVTFVNGLAEDFCSASFRCTFANPAGGQAAGAIGYDSITAIVGSCVTSFTSAQNSMGLGEYERLDLGAHYFQAMETTVGGTATFYGSLSPSSSIQNALHFEGWF